MPGYCIHFAACSKDVLNNRSFVLGIEAPDLYKYFGIGQLIKEYDKLKTEEMPPIEQLIPRVIAKECVETKSGLHYGISSNPGIREFWGNLSEKEKCNPFYRGYAWHLITDKYFYTRIKIEGKMQSFVENSGSISEAVDTLHEDFDRANAYVLRKYDVMIPEEILSFNIINYSNGKTKFFEYSDFQMLLII